MQPRHVTIALAAAFAIALAWWMTRSPNDTPPASQSGIPVATDAPLDGRLANQASPQRTAAATDESARTEATERSFVVRGRCIADADGTPIADATVTLCAAEPERMAPLATAATTADGRFVASAACLDGLVARIDIAATGFAAVTGRWRADRPREIDVGDVRLLAAVIVEGQVLTDRGQPVEAAEVMLAVVKPESPGFAPHRLARTESAADGRFRFPEPIATGDWYAIVNHAGGLIAPRDVHVPSGVDRHFLRVTTTTPDLAMAIRGIVVDSDGAPMERVDLRANGDGSTGSARTRADGTFVLHRSGAFTNTGGKDVLVFLSEPTGGFEIAGDTPRTHWGAEGLRIVMRRLAATTIVVTDPAGAPIADIDAFVVRINPASVAPRLVRSRGSKDGRIAVPRLAAGRYVVIARPRDGSPPTAALPFVVENGRAPTEIRVTVGEPAHLAVDVVGTDGAPVADSRIDAMLVLRGEPPPPATRVPLLATAHGDDPWREGSVVVATGTTNARGRALLRLHDGDVALRVHGSLHAPIVVAASMQGEGTRIRVVVETAGRIIGHCEPLAALAELRAAAGDAGSAIEVIAATGDTIGARSPIDENGTFSLDGLRPGTWSVRMSLPLRCNPDYETVVALALDDAVVTSGTTERPFAIDAVRPANASGTVTLDGLPWPRAQLIWQRDRPRTIVRAVADAHGRFHTLLPPGDYAVAVAFAAQPGPGWINVVVPPRWSVIAGRDEQRTISARARTVRIRVLDAANAPVADAPVRVGGEFGYYRPGALSTDANGVVTITHPPYGTFDLVVGPAEHELRVGPIDAGDEPTTTPIDARPRAN